MKLKSKNELTTFSPQHAGATSLADTVNMRSCIVFLKLHVLFFFFYQKTKLRFCCTTHLIKINVLYFVTLA